MSSCSKRYPWSIRFPKPRIRDYQHCKATSAFASSTKPTASLRSAMEACQGLWSRVSSCRRVWDAGRCSSMKAKMLVRERCEPAQGARHILLLFPSLLAAPTALYLVKRVVSFPAFMKYNRAAGLRPGTSSKQAPRTPGTSTYSYPSSSLGTLFTSLRCSVEVARLPMLTYRGACWRDDAGWVRTGEAWSR
jgi:hypothetical protein